MTPSTIVSPTRRVRPLGIRATILYLLTACAWYLWGGIRAAPPLWAAVWWIFVLTFAVSAAVPALMLERRWIRSSLACSAGAFVLAWALLVVAENTLKPHALLGCAMHEVDEGGLPDAVCYGPVSPLFSYGRRAFWYLPLVAVQAVMLALWIAFAARAVRLGVRWIAWRRGWRLPRPSPRTARAAALLGWLVPGAILAAAFAYGPVVQAREERAAAAREAASPRGPSVDLFFRTEDDSLEAGDRERLVAWVWYSKDGSASAEPLDSVRLNFRSLSPAVAEVDGGGLLRALAPGTARIVVNGHALGARARLAEGKADTLKVRVYPPDARLRALRFVDVAASPHVEFGATCAVADDGAAYCWGTGVSDRDVDEDGAARSFVRVAGPEPFATVTLGVSHACALGRSGRAYCWGANDEGQAGIGGRRQSVPQPEAVAGGHAWAQLRAGRDHTCGIDTQGALYCWGSDRSGQLAPAAISTRCPASLLGIGRRPRESWRCALAPTPVLARMRFREVATGAGHTCALDVTGAVWCWGDNWNHQSSPAAPEQMRSPAGIPLPPLVHLAGGTRSNCGVDVAGRTWCWGYYRYGERKDEDPGRGFPRPQGVAGANGLQSLSAGSEHACGVAADGQAWCWGANSEFELGSGNPTDQDAHANGVPVAGGLRFRTVSAGAGYTCGVTVQGGLYCWGSGLSFRFTGANSQETPEPVRLAGPPG